MATQVRASTAAYGHPLLLIPCTARVPQLLKPLIHVDAAWKEADGPDNEDAVDDGIPAYPYSEVHAVRIKLRETLGTDLTKHVAGNSMWHTGNAVDLEGGDYRERTPWVYDEEVRAGRSVGKGRATRMIWADFMSAFVLSHWLCPGDQ